MPIGFVDYVSLGRPQWRGEASAAKSAFFRFLGSADTHGRIRNTHVLNAIEQLPLPEQTRVLELGSGRGMSLFWLARHHPAWKLEGIDMDPEMAGTSERAAREGGFENLRFEIGDAENLAASEEYELIISIDMLEHIQDDYGLLVKIRKALRPTGFLVLHVPRRRYDQWRWISAFGEHEVDGHVAEEYQEEDIQAVVERAGFQIASFRQTFGHWGEISFELNKLAWRRRWLRNLLALVTYPVAVPLGWLDVGQTPERGNSFLLCARPASQ
jgi:SAM-dependent methyltransferase